MSQSCAHNETALKDASVVYEVATEDGIDISLLKDNLAKTPWERMQANDDALNFAESLRTAMEKRNALNVRMVNTVGTL